MRSAPVLLARALLVAAAAAPAVSPPPREHGPIALYEPPLLAPVETAGVAPPLVRAKLVIDVSGKVTRVEVAALEPSTALDEVYRAAAREGLSAWRFAPAEKDGRAVPSETLLAIPFERPEARPGGDLGGRYLWSSSTESGYESSRYDERARILGLTLAERRKVGDRIAAIAEGLIKKDRRAAAADDWFEVVTDFGGQKQADALLHNLGATFAALYKLLGERVPPLPRQDRIRVYVFETEAQYQALCAQTMPFEGSAGFYSASGVLAFHTQHPTVGFFLASMLHETTHAFMDRHLAGPGVELPRWLGEGFAEYVGTSDVKDGKIIPGGHKKKQELGAAPGAPVFWQTSSKARADQAKQAQRQHRALTLEELVAAGPETFYGKDADLYYAQGWLAVHFLRHGRPEWADGAFPKFLLYAAEGYPATDALRAAYGVSASDLEAAYQKYVKSF